MDNLNRRSFIKSGFASGAALTMTTSCMKDNGVSPGPPNVIIVMTDDQGYGELGCHGNTVIRTPNIDRFHDESVRFSRFFVSPTCSPTRAGLLTGRHEFRCGISHTILGRSLIRDDEVTIADILSNAGYRTGLFGKWHLGDNAPCRPMDKGFQEYLYHGGGGISQTPDFWGNTYFSPTLNHNGTWEKREGYCTDIFFDEALDWIAKNRTNPFFALITPNTPHYPLQVAESYSKPYEDAGLAHEAANFYGMITNIDDNMGKLTDRLRELELDENTLVIFMTDNGSSEACNRNLYNAGMRGCKGSPHEGGVRVPCFFRWPGTLEGGRDITTNAAHIDLLPTLAALCGVELPEGRDIDGLNLQGLLNKSGKQLPDRLLITHLGRWPAEVQPQKYANCSVRSQRFRFVNNAELYDMDTDPGETDNVISSFPDVVRKMREMYDTWWDEVLPRVSTFQHIRLGYPGENPAVLTCMDWKVSLISPAEPDWRTVHLWRQDCLAALAENKPYMVRGERCPGGTMGSWAVEFERAGDYRFTLRKVPSSAPQKMRELAPGTAFMQCGDIHRKKRIAGGIIDTVSFDVRLDSGPADLECWFDGQRYDRGLSGAYFVEVEYVEG
ncbi:arylsulfatase [Candidatus Latescibacterota bacterium]